MEDPIRVTFTDVNLEIIAKLLNPVARKYGCRVRYMPRENRLNFIGDQACYEPIVEEVLGFFFTEPVVAPIPARQKPGVIQ